MMSDSTGQIISILSIDGGGVRGIIPAKVLEFLEEMFQELDGPNARISDYFDIIAGTSTGGLIAAMLTVPDPNTRRPMFTAKDATRFYLDYSSVIFPQKQGIIGYAKQVFNLFKGPKYSNKPLLDQLEKYLGDLRLRDTITNVLIPTFDIKLQQPVFFSTFEAIEDVSKNAYLRDVIMGTTAAPTLLPPYYFETNCSSGKPRSFNLIDGGVAAKNPSYLAIIHVLKQAMKGDPCFSPKMKSKHYEKVLVLSLGTGNRIKGFEAKDASKWGLLSWVASEGGVPIVDTVLNASVDMVDYNLSVVFQTIECPENYLRIQEDELAKSVASTDTTTAEHVENLARIGIKLLDKHVKKVNLDTGTYEAVVGAGSNRDAMEKFAKRLSEERMLHIKRVDL